jgi:hypothetical protein
MATSLPTRLKLDSEMKEACAETCFGTPYVVTLDPARGGRAVFGS